MNPKIPRVTILMSVFNNELYVAEAMESILKQTFSDFEFLIVDDGSTDHSLEIMNAYHDPRIRLVSNEKNVGLVYSLNRGIDLALGEYIARMDGDDVSAPDRIEKQVRFMDQHPEIGVSGTWIDRGYVPEFPIDHEAILIKLKINNQFGHNSVIIRKSVLRQHQLYYDPSYTHAEDYEMWVRMSKITRLANIPEALVKYRMHPLQVSKIYAAEQQAVADRIRAQLNQAVN